EPSAMGDQRPRNVTGALVTGRLSTTATLEAHWCSEELAPETLRARLEAARDPCHRQRRTSWEGSLCSKIVRRSGPAWSRALPTCSRECPETVRDPAKTTQSGSSRRHRSDLRALGRLLRSRRSPNRWAPLGPWGSRCPSTELATRLSSRLAKRSTAVHPI